MNKKDPIMMQEIKSSVAKEKDDFVFLLDLLCNENNTGLLYDIVKACGSDSSLSLAVSPLIDKLSQARKNVLPELDNLIKLIEDNIHPLALSVTEKSKSNEDTIETINL